jgi:hypothetical protein
MSTTNSGYSSYYSWYYDSGGTGSLTWVNAHAFRQHWAAINGVGHFRAWAYYKYSVSQANGTNWATLCSVLKKGDIIQYTRNSDGITHHTKIVPYVSNDTIIVAQHGAQNNTTELKTYLQQRINNGLGSEWLTFCLVKKGI